MTQVERHEESAAAEPLIVAENVKKHFSVTRGLVFRQTVGQVRAVDGVSFSVPQGQTYSLVGESGCGKTTTAKVVLLVESLTSGTLRFEGRDVSAFTPDQLTEYRASVQAVFQDPWSSLNPRLKVESIIAEPLTAHRRLTKAELREQVLSLLEEVGLHPSHAYRYPHEFSGGQRQRIAIARALALRPKLIVLDEPVSALDVSIRAQIMNLLKQLQIEYNLSYLLIAHQLATVRYMSHKIGVMYLGKIVEEADSHDLFDNPRHPYTRALISASLSSRPGVEREEIVLTGEVPSPIDPPSGCAFHPRCPSVFEPCADETPVIESIAEGHIVSCHLYQQGGR